MHKEVEHHKTEERKLIIRIVSIIVVALLVIILYNVTKVEACVTETCFETSMFSCDKIRFINEEPEATWGYEILGERKNQCEIEVTLLNAKRGSLAIESLVGQSMICNYPLEIIEYPEKNLDLCHGRLKEGLQERIIAQLHEYIIANLGEIQEDITGI